jgi:hypothetical protein
LPLARTVSRFRFRVEVAVSMARTWSAAWEASWEAEDEGEAGDELKCKTLLRPKTPVPRTMKTAKLRAIARGRRENQLEIGGLGSGGIGGGGEVLPKDGGLGLTGVDEADSK